MFIGDLFEAKGSVADIEKSELYQTTKDQRVRDMLRVAHAENPDAQSDLEALAGHMANVDAINKRQDREEKILRQRQDALVKDLTDKEVRFRDQEQRFRDFNKKVAAMGLTTAQQAQAADDFIKHYERGEEPDMSKYEKMGQANKEKSKDQDKQSPAFNVVTGTPKGDYTPTAVDATPSAKDKKPSKAQDKKAADAKTKLQMPKFAPKVAAPVSPIAAVAPKSLTQPVQQTLPGFGSADNLGGRLGTLGFPKIAAANEPEYQEPKIPMVAEAEQHRALTQAEIDQLLQYNAQQFRKAYSSGSGCTFYFGLGRTEDLDRYEVEAAVSAIASNFTPEVAEKEVWIPLFTDFDYFHAFKQQFLSQQNLQWHQQKESFTEAEMVSGNFGPAANDPQFDLLKNRALEVIRAAYNPKISDEQIHRLKMLFKQDFPEWTFAETADTRIAYIVNHSMNTRIPLVRLDKLNEDSWHAGDNAWSSEHDLWARESQETTVADMSIQHEKGYHSVYYKKSGEDKWTPLTKYTDPLDAKHIAAQMKDKGYEVIVREGTPQDSIQRYLGIESQDDVDAVKKAIHQIAKDPSLASKSKARLLSQIGMMINSKRLPVGHKYYQYIQQFMEAKATKQRLDPKCWKGKHIGTPKTKVKGGVRVNNCVPNESVNYWEKLQNERRRKAFGLVEELEKVVSKYEIK